MEKISGIIPSNSRISSVDLSKSVPTRRGHPNMGQPQVDASMHKSMLPKTILKQASGAYAQAVDLRQKNRQDSIQANKIQDEFFKSRMEPETEEIFEAGREDLLANVEPVEIDEEALFNMGYTEVSDDTTQEVGTNLSVVA